MSKPEDIPQGVWDKAVVIADASEPSTETLARAILAAKAEEREACAGWHDHNAEAAAAVDDPYAAWHRANAAAIRSRSEG